MKHLIDNTLARLFALNFVQIAVASLIGLAAGASMYLGYCADVLR